MLGAGSSPMERGQWCGAGALVPISGAEVPGGVLRLPKGFLAAEPTPKTSTRVFGALDVAVGQGKNVFQPQNRAQMVCHRCPSGWRSCVPHPSQDLSGDVPGGTDEQYPPLLGMLLCTPKPQRTAPSPHVNPKRGDKAPALPYVPSPFPPSHQTPVPSACPLSGRAARPSPSPGSCTGPPTPSRRLPRGASGGPPGLRGARCPTARGCGARGRRTALPAGRKPR